MTIGTANLLSSIALVLCFCSFVLQLLGITCPGWIVLFVNLEVLQTLSGSKLTGFGQVLSQSAVWYGRVCVYGDSYSSCVASLHDDRNMAFKISSSLAEFSTLDWVEVEIELSVAILLCILGCVQATVSLCKKKSAKLLSALASPCMLVSGVLILPAVFRVGLSIHDTRTAIAVLFGDSELLSVLLPWALALSAAGLILGLSAGVLLLFAACKHERTTVVEISSEGDTLPETILKIGNFPLKVARFSDSDMEGHIPPHMPRTLGPTGLPPIGAHDEEPLQFVGKGLTREDTFDPCTVKPPHMIANGGQPFLFEETVMEVSTPPPFERMPTNLSLKKENTSTSIKNRSDKVQKKSDTIELKSKNKVQSGLPELRNKTVNSTVLNAESRNRSPKLTNALNTESKTKGTNLNRRHLPVRGTVSPNINGKPTDKSAGLEHV